LNDIDRPTGLGRRNCLYIIFIPRENFELSETRHLCTEIGIDRPAADHRQGAGLGPARAAHHLRSPRCLDQTGKAHIIPDGANLSGPAEPLQVLDEVGMAHRYAEAAAPLSKSPHHMSAKEPGPAEDGGESLTFIVCGFCVQGAGLAGCFALPDRFLA
jgi:hypothetical protein